MAKPDGRVEKGQSLKRAISATRWNDLCDAADIVHGRRGGVTAGNSRSRTLIAKTSEPWEVGFSQTLTLYSPPTVKTDPTDDQEPSQLQEAGGQVLAWNLLHPVPSNEYVVLQRIGELLLLTGSREEVVLVGAPQFFWAKNSDEFFIVKEKDEQTGQLVATDRKVIATNLFVDIDAGTTSVVARVGPNWYVIAAEC